MGNRLTRRLHGPARPRARARGRHKILPALVLLIAFAPAVVSVAVAAFLNDIESDQLISYGEYTFIIGSALALFAALIAPEALCPDRRSGLLGLYLAGPLDRNRYLLGKGGAVYFVMLGMSLCPLLFMYLAFVVAGFGPSASATPKLMIQILASGLATGIAYAALSLATASFTTRRAVAAVAVILLLLVPDIAARAAIEDGGAPDALSLLGMPAVVYELSSGSSARRNRATPDHTRLDRAPPRGLLRVDGTQCGGVLAPLPADRGLPVSAAPHVVAEGVSKWFGSLVAVSDVSFEIGPGVTALLGPNGAGKSTMLRMLCGLARPSRGTVRVLGRNPATDVQVAGSIGLVPQQETVFEPLTANRFLQLTAKLEGLPDPATVATSALESVGLDPADTRRLPATRRGCASA